MNKETTLALWAQGKDAWNAWAKDMLGRRAEMEAAGTWALSRDELGFEMADNQDTADWMAVAVASFIEFVFDSEPDFMGLYFPGLADFSQSTFPTYTKFQDATFYGEARFDDATFCGAAWFTNSTFKEDARFYNVSFEGEAIFLGATFAKKQNLDSENLWLYVTLIQQVSGVLYF